MTVETKKGRPLKPEGTKKKKLTISFNPLLREKVDEACERLAVSRTDLIETAVKEYLTRNKQKE
jgi:metal-responsive CopG/Arc/MetJ family transcriptional regulator